MLLFAHAIYLFKADRGTNYRYCLMSRETKITGRCTFFYSTIYV